MLTDRMRFTVIEANTNKILTRDLEVKEHQVTKNLSAPTQISLKIDKGQQKQSAAGINWKSYGHFIIPEISTSGFGRKCIGGPLVTMPKIDAQSGDMLIDGQGFMGYPKGIPWLENFNPIAVDPAEVFQRVWAHIQSFINANMGVQVLPASTGTQMLPGYGFDGSILSFDFFALFIRAVDFVDSGDFLTSLARDLPLDLFEEVTWNADRTAINKVLRLAYPLGGVQQDHLVFRLGENVSNVELAEEFDIEPVSDVIIRGWIPGRVYTSRLSNADMTRYRRVVMEEDANISSTERAAAWGKRKLQRRNIPTSFQKITVDPDHWHAPIGSYDVGDSIRIQAPDYPWHGDIDQWHRIISMTFKHDSPFIELGVKADGAWNYDPIEVTPPGEVTPPVDQNLLSNGYFTSNLGGWYAKKGQWIRVATQGYSGDGSVRIDCDDDGEQFDSERVSVISGYTYTFGAAVRWQEINPHDDAPWIFGLRVNTFQNGGRIGDGVLVATTGARGAGPYTPMSAQFQIPDGVNEVSISLLVNNRVEGGIAFWDDCKILP